MAKGKRQFTVGQELARRNVIAKMRSLDPPVSPTDLVERSKVTTAPQLLRGQRWPQPTNLAKIDVALGLPPGTIQAWADGDEKFFAESEPERPSRPTIDDASDLELVLALLARIQIRNG